MKKLIKYYAISTVTSYSLLIGTAAYLYPELRKDPTQVAWAVIR